MVDLRHLAKEMDRGIFSFMDAVVLMNEYERLNLTGCEDAIDRIDHGYDNVDDLRAIHNAIDVAYGKANVPTTPFNEVCDTPSLREQVRESLHGGSPS